MSWLLACKPHCSVSTAMAMCGLKCAYVLTTNNQHMLRAASAAKSRTGGASPCLPQPLFVLSSAAPEVIPAVGSLGDGHGGA